MACQCGGLVCATCIGRWWRLKDSTKRQRLCRVRNSIGYAMLREDREPTEREQLDLNAIALILDEED